MGKVVELNNEGGGGDLKLEPGGGYSGVPKEPGQNTGTQGDRTIDGGSRQRFHR